MRALALAAFAAVAAVLAVAAGADAAPAAERCTPTYNDGSGPFGRGMPPVRAKVGRGHVLSGVVLSAAGCGPIQRAQVHVWYRSREGYVRATSATVFTDRQGRFRFESGRPFEYGPPPHFHLRIVAPQHEVMLTRHMVTGRRGQMRIVVVPFGV